MLAAAQRLRKSSDFTAAFRGGRRVGRSTLVVHLHSVHPHTVEPAQAIEARAGFVVSRAVGPAVVRNKVRRRLRHLVRPVLGTLPDGSTLVIRALPAAATASFDMLRADLDAAISAARSPRRRR